jgi:hypothetical protein
LERELNIKLIFYLLQRFQILNGHDGNNPLAASRVDVSFYHLWPKVSIPGWGAGCEPAILETPSTDRGIEKVLTSVYNKAMGDKEKLEQKARRAPGGLRIEDVIRLAEEAGFQVTRTTRGRCICKHPHLRHTVGLAEPHGKGDSFVKPVYVRNLLSAIDAVHRILDDEQDGASED